MINALLWWYGVVVDNNDPRQIGRVRVRVYGEYDSHAVDALPWANVFGMGIQQNGIGDFIALDPGTQVIGYFADGRARKRPVVMAAMHNIPEDDIANHSVSPLARGEQILDKKIAPSSIEQESQYAAKYPFNRVITTRSGHAIELDDTEGAERIHIYHKSGAYIEMNPDGSIQIKSKDDSYEIVGKDKNLEVNEDLTIVVKGNISAHSDGDISITSQGKMDLTSGGPLKISAVHGFTLETDADATIKTGGGLGLMKGGLTSIGPVNVAGGWSGHILDKNGQSVTFSKGIAVGSIEP